MRTSWPWLIQVILWGALLVGCSSPQIGTSGAMPMQSDEAKIESLTADLRKLGMGVDPHEARGVAETSVQYSRLLAAEYRMVKPAFVHNVFVNMKWRDRGLCFHWADDLQERLLGCGFRTLKLHRVVSGINTPREHNALVVSALKQPMREGLVLDGWRHGGDLFWGPVSAETKYRWEIRTDFPWMKNTEVDEGLKSAGEGVKKEQRDAGTVP